MKVAIIDGGGNDLDFVLDVALEDIELTKRLGVKGLLAWYCASHPEDWKDDEDFTRDDVDSFYGLGYAEPAMMLLEKHGIAYTLMDPEYDPDGNLICYDWAEC